MSKQRADPNWRMPVGIFMMIAEIIVLAIVVALLSSRISQLPGFIQFLVYLLGGLIWIAPLRPLMIWMETGKWRE